MSECDNSVEAFEDNWKILFRYTEGRSSIEDVTAALKDVRKHSLKHGISSLQLDCATALLNKLTEDGEEFGICLQVLYILIPSEPLTVSQLDELLKWFEVSYRSNSDVSKHFTIWLLVCLQVGVISKEYLQSAYYYNLLHLLISNPRDDALSWIIKRLTKPSLVTEFYFTKLYDCYTTFVKARRYFVQLVQQYAEIMPEVSQKLKIKKLVQVHSLKIGDRIMKKTLDRILVLHVMNASLDETLNCKEDLNNSNKSSFFKMSPVYEIHGGINITDLVSLESVITYYDLVQVPDNILSLLASKGGQYYISLSSRQLTNQLEEQVEAILNNLLNNQSRSSLDKIGFLNALAETQATCSQGMPVVSQFLSAFIICWDGNKFKNAIFDLIPWFSFKSFKELDIFMKNLFNVFVCMTLEGKSKIVTAFGELYANLWISCNKKSPVPFIGHQPDWTKNNMTGVMGSITKYFRSFIYTGLVAHGSDPAFLTHALLLYYEIFLLEKKFDFAVSTVMPQMLVFMCQTSSCISVLNLLSKILTLYLRNRDIMVSDNIEFLRIIQIYCTDTVSILLHGVGGRYLESLSLGSLFSESDLAELEAAFGHVTNLLSVSKHFAFLPVLKEISEKLNIKISNIKPENFIDILDLIAPDCGLLVRETAASVSET